MKNYSLSSLWIVVVVLVVTQLSCCHGKKQNRDLPHIHRGVLSSYEAGPFESIELDKNDEKVLDSGKPIMKMTQGEGDELGGSSICVQDVAAPKVRSVRFYSFCTSALAVVGFGSDWPGVVLVIFQRRQPHCFVVFGSRSTVPI